MKKPRSSAPSCFGFPISIFFIVINEFCERFSYYGMRAVLVLYFKFFLHWDDNLSTVIYHTFVALCYLTPILGAIVADSWLGKFKTIVSLSIVYTIGQVVMAVGSINDLTDYNRDGTPDRLSVHIALSVVGLILIAFGTGGIKPCVAAFGGDQFEDDQEKQRSMFFSIFYLSINAGSLISTVVTPILRALEPGGECYCYLPPPPAHQIQQQRKRGQVMVAPPPWTLELYKQGQSPHYRYGEECGIHTKQRCYPLAFGVPAALMAVALVVFIVGSSMYKKVLPQGNIMVQVSKCIAFAVGNRFRHRSKQFPKREHWLDWASEKYDNRLITQTKMVLRVLFLYIPLPMFWALFDQQGSRWTLQATTMNGDFGNMQIQPDQMQTVNPILIIVMVPVVDAVVYPLIKKCRINFTPLKRMTVGMFLAAMAFVAAALVQVQIDKTLPVFPVAGQTQIKVINLDIAEAKVNFGPGLHDVSLPSQGETDYFMLDAASLKTLTVSYGSRNKSRTLAALGQKRYTLEIKNNTVDILDELVLDNISSKPEEGNNLIRFINNLPSTANITMNNINFGEVQTWFASNYTAFQKGTKKIVVTDSSSTCQQQSIPFGFGSAYTIIINECGSSGLKIRYVQDIPPNTVHMAWQIPQYFLMTCGEVVFSVTGLEFSYSQAPSNMKSVLQAGWLLTVAVGNIIVLIVAGASKLDEQWAEYVLFAALLLAVCIIFAIMAYFYTYVDPAEVEAQLDEEEKKKKKEMEMGKEGTAYENGDVIAKVSQTEM